jgi:predicted phosphodiesterase
VATAVLSDLHLGAAPVSVRDQLASVVGALAGLGGVERLVLLGDVLEVRGSGRQAASQLGRELCQRLAEVGIERPVIVWGNHDHPFARTPPQGWPGNPQLHYPGIWLRPDAYATHGHYLDCHLLAPPAERLAVAVAARVVRLGRRSTAARYEQAVRPIYRICELTATRRSGGQGPAAAPSPHHRRGWRQAARTLAIRLAPGWQEDPAAAEDLALAQAAAALGATPQYLIYGHTHRPGIRPLPGSPGRYAVNCGSWQWGPAGPQGWSVLLGSDGPPRLVRLCRNHWQEVTGAEP